MASASYAQILRTKLGHAPVMPTRSEDQKNAETMRRQECVEPELVAAASYLGRFAEFHPTRASPGEELLDNLYRSSAGFFINKQAVEVKLDKDKVMKEVELFQKFVVIAYFVGGALPYASVLEWLKGIKDEISNDCKLGREIGNGLFQIVTKSEPATQKILMHSPHLSKWGTCIMQPWIANFNPVSPIGLKLPVWITLKGVRDELLTIAQKLAAGIGVVLGRHRNNVFSADQKFCIVVQSDRPFDLEITIVNPATNEEMRVQVVYNNLPIGCRLCRSTSHLIKGYERALGVRKNPIRISRPRGGGYQRHQDTNSRLEETKHHERGGWQLPHHNKPQEGQRRWRGLSVGNTAWRVE